MRHLTARLPGNYKLVMFEYSFGAPLNISRALLNLAQKADTYASRSAATWRRNKKIMRDRTKKSVKWGAGVVAIIYMLVVGFDQFFGGATFSYVTTAREEHLQQTLASCRGTFRERYDCKSSILLAQGRNSFNYWSKKYLISFAPPIFIYVAFHIWLGRVETVEEKLRRERLAIRMEKRRQKDSRIAFEQGRQRSLAAKRRQAVQQAHQAATREDKKRPLTVMVIIQNEKFVEQLNEAIWEGGYFAVQTDLRDVFLSYRDIGYHIILTDTEFDEPDIHPEDIGDEEFPGQASPLDITLKGLRDRKENVRIIAMSPDFAGLAAKEYIETATALGVDALLEKPFEFTAFVDLADKLMDTGINPDSEDSA